MRPFGRRVAQTTEMNNLMSAPVSAEQPDVALGELSFGEFDGSQKVIPTDELTFDEFCTMFDAVHKASIKSISLQGAVHLNLCQQHLMRSSSPGAFLLYCQQKEEVSRQVIN